jgi:hypothetical protein
MLSRFPYIWGKFSFLFLSVCTRSLPVFIMYEWAWWQFSIIDRKEKTGTTEDARKLWWWWLTHSTYVLYVEYRAVSGVLQNIDLSTQRVCPPPHQRGYTSPGGEGVGGSIFWKTPDIGLASYSIIPLRWLILSAQWVSSELSLIGGTHIGARALLDILLIWLGYIVCLSQWGGGRYFTCWNDFYLPSRRLEEGGGKSAPYVSGLPRNPFLISSCGPTHICPLKHLFCSE